MAKVKVTPRALAYMPTRSKDYTLYRFQGFLNRSGGDLEATLSEGKPGNTLHYTVREFDGIKIYVSDSLLNRQITIDLARFLFWKWLIVDET